MTLYSGFGCRLRGASLIMVITILITIKEKGGKRGLFRGIHSHALRGGSEK